MENKTLSLHGGKQVGLEHNRRVKGKEGKTSTIHPERTKNNVILIDIDAKEAYKKLFQQAVDEYNEKQKRSDRKIKDYYSKIKQDKNKNLYYEYIFQLGSSKDPVDEETFIAVCADYVSKFRDRNPNLYTIGAYIHLDEDASPHMHMVYIPIGHYETGQKVQASSNRAFEEMTGYKSKNRRDTAQIKWQESERQYIKELCAEYGIEIVDGDSKGKKSLSTAVFKAQKDMEQAIQKSKEAQEMEEAANDRIKSAREEIARSEKQIEEDQKQAQEVQEQAQKRIGEINRELSDAEGRLKKVRHDMNNEYLELMDRFEREMEGLYAVADKYGLDEYSDLADRISADIDMVLGDDR